MENINNYKQLKFEHIVMQGTHYEIGQFRGETIKKYADELAFFTSPLKGEEFLSVAEVNKIMKVYDEFCPGLNQEILGFADSLGIEQEKVVYYANSFGTSCNCSQMVVLPTITKNHHTYVARSYEYFIYDELRLCTTRVTGKAAHIGFSLFLFGRFDGINEHGLCVTMSASTPGKLPESKGCTFWVVIRSLLDNCKDVSDALQLIKSMPISANTNFLLADKSGQAVLVEVACFNGKTKIGIKNSNEYLVSTNHYTTDDTIPYTVNKMWQSVKRYNIMHSAIKDNVQNIDKDTLKNILSKKMPNGVCCHQFDDGLGTLRSMLFDVTNQAVDICFGPPSINKWKSFGFNDAVGTRQYSANYYNEPAPKPKTFWSKI